MPYLRFLQRIVHKLDQYATVKVANVTKTGLLPAHTRHLTWGLYLAASPSPLVREGWRGVRIRVAGEASLSEKCFLAYTWPLMVKTELGPTPIVASVVRPHSHPPGHPCHQSVVTLLCQKWWKGPKSGHWNYYFFNSSLCRLVLATYVVLLHSWHKLQW